MNAFPSTEIERAVDVVRARFADELAEARPFRVLVLFDPDATICRVLAASGDEVACCPDRQRGHEGADEHVNELCDDATSLFSLDGRWDLIVAAEGWSRFRAVHSRAEADWILEWVRTHADIAIIEAPRRALAPDLNNLGAFEVHRILGGFRFHSELEPSQQSDAAPEPPLILASDRWLLVGDEWFETADLEQFDTDSVDAEWKTVRTFAARGDRIVKVECVSEDYFERSQVLAEAVFLEQAGAGLRQSLGLPGVHNFARGRAVISLVRDRVVGTALRPEAPDEIALMQAAILDNAANFARAGMFHNDLRLWNVVWDGKRAAFIDFGDSSRRDDDVRELPQILALAGTLASLATGEIRGGEDFYDDLLEVVERAGILARWPLLQQFTDPWLALPNSRTALTLTGDLDAAGIIETVLSATMSPTGAARLNVTNVGAARG